MLVFPWTLCAAQIWATWTKGKRESAADCASDADLCTLWHNVYLISPMCGVISSISVAFAAHISVREITKKVYKIKCRSGFLLLDGVFHAITGFRWLLFVYTELATTDAETLVRLKRSFFVFSGLLRIENVAPNIVSYFVKASFNGCIEYSSLIQSRPSYLVFPS